MEKANSDTQIEKGETGVKDNSEALEEVVGEIFAMWSAHPGDRPETR